jgi:hypothetical protein
MGQTRARRTQARWIGALAAAALFATACGDDGAGALGQLTDAFGGGEEDVEAAAATEDAGDTAAAADDSAAEQDDGADDTEATSADVTDAGSVAAPIETQPMDFIVRNGGFEYTLTGLEVVDLDEGAEQRMRGVELHFDVSVYNPWGSSGFPRSNVSLQWNEEGGENVATVNGRGEFREIPPQSSSSGEIIVPLTPADLDRFHQPSARLIIGTSGSSAAEVPLGPEAELIDRLPVTIPLDLVMDMGSEDGGFVTTFHDAIIVYEHDRRGVADGEAILELRFDLDNQGAGQSCSTRGTGAFGLTVPNGDGIVEIGVSERCVVGNQVERGVLTGFSIDADYAGEYTLTHQRPRAAETLEGQITFTLEETPGSPAER